MAQRDLPCPLCRRPWAMCWGVLSPQTLTQGLSGAAAPRRLHNLPGQLSAGSLRQPLCVDAMSPLHHKRGPYFSGFWGGSGVTLTAREPAHNRAAGHACGKHIRDERKSKQAGRSAVLQCHPNLSSPPGISPGFSASPQRGPLNPFAHPLVTQNLWRRCWRSLCEMEQWKLTVLLFISSLSVWGLCMLVLPCTPSLLAVLGLGIFMTWCPNCKAKVGVRRGIAPNTPWAGVSPGQSPSLGFSGGAPFWEGAVNSGRCPPSPAVAPEPPSHLRSGTRLGARDAPVPGTPVTLPRVLVCRAGALLAEGRHPTLTRALLSRGRGPLWGRAVGKAGGRTR